MKARMIVGALAAVALLAGCADPNVSAGAPAATSSASQTTPVAAGLPPVSLDTASAVYAGVNATVDPAAATDLASAQMTPAQIVAAGCQVACDTSQTPVSIQLARVSQSTGSAGDVLTGELAYVVTYPGVSCGTMNDGPQQPSGVPSPSYGGKLCVMRTVVDAASGKYLFAFVD